MSKNNDVVKLSGYKKGGGGGRVAQEAEDTLQSKAFARVLDLVSEGEIEGLVDGARSIYFDGTQLQSSGGDYNFSDVITEVRLGQQNQEHIAGFSDVENEVNVGVEVKKDFPVVRTITNVNVDAVRVKVLIPQLSEQNKETGDINGSSVKIAIDVESAAGGYTTVAEDEIVGKTMSRYERQYRIPLHGSAPWNVRVRRISDDSTSASINNKTWFSSMTEIVEAKLSYPNSAIIAVRVDASQFSAIPTRAYHIRGLRIRVPTNYDPITREYTGVWDGTFKIAWSNNPAWCFYDILTNERYGLGKLIQEDAVDKWSLYKIGRYCDELVPNGFGGTEPRFTLNCYIQTREEAYTLLNDLASAFRGMLYWSAGAVVATQDAPTDATYLFNNSNVIEGQFSYSGTSVKARHTVALVSWNDLGDMGRQKIEYVEDAEGIERYGVVETEVAAFGCTSRAQAHRVGRWILYSEIAETESVTFSTGFEGAVVRPGHIIKIADSVRFGKRFGGRILSATSNSISLDSPVTIQSGMTYKVYVIKPDGSMHESNISGGTGVKTTLNLATSMNPVPERGATWVLSEVGAAEAREYRVLGVVEKDQQVYEISAIEHDSTKFAKVDSSVKLGSFNGGEYGDGGGGGGTIPGVPPEEGVPVPEDITVNVVEYEDAGALKFKVVVSWANRDGIVGWESTWQKDNENQKPVTDLTLPSYEILDAQPGYYYIKVRAKDLAGRYSPWANAPLAYVGSLDLSDVFTTLSADPGFLQIRLYWGFKQNVTAVSHVEVWGTKGMPEGGYEYERLLAVKAFPEDNFSHMNLPVGDVWKYQIRAVDKFGGFGPFYPPEGVIASPNMDMNEIFDSIKDGFINSSLGQELLSRTVDIEIPALDDVYDRINKLRSDANRDGELLLRSILVDETIRQENTDNFASVWSAYGVIQDGLALEASRSSALEVRVGNTEAAVLEEASARADGDSANASQISALVARLNNFSDVQGKSIEAYIVDEQNARVTADEAVADQVNGVIARIDNFDPTGKPLTSLEARFAEEQTARVDGDSANAQAITQVTARLNDVDGVTLEQKFQANASQIDGLSAQYTVKIDNNGYVSGFGLASTPVDGVPVSTFAINADRFLIVNPNNGNPVVPFAVVDTSEFGLDWNTIVGSGKDALEQDAENAILAIGDMSSDNKFSPVEKIAVKREWEQIVAEKTELEDQATVLDVTVEKTTYVNAYTALNTYITPLLADTNSTSNIVAATFREKFNTYYSAKTVLIKAMETKIDQKAGTALSNAATASSNATNAVNTANAANNMLADIASDSKLTPGEKISTKKEWDIIVAEKTPIETQATTYSISTEKTAYTNAYNALSAYITPLLTNMSETSNIVGSTFRTTFANYYTAKTTLLKKISDTAKSLADSAATTANWTGVSSRPTTLSGLDSSAGTKLNGIQAGATVGATIGTNLSGQMSASNIATWIANGAIGTALIGDAQISTLKIQGEAVTIPRASYISSGSSTSVGVPAQSVGSRMVVASLANYVFSTSGDLTTLTLYLKRNGTTLASIDILNSKSGTISYRDTSLGSDTYSVEVAVTSGTGSGRGLSIFVLGAQR